MVSISCSNGFYVLPTMLALQPLDIVTCNFACAEILADPEHTPKTRSP